MTTAREHEKTQDYQQQEISPAHDSPLTDVLVVANEEVQNGMLGIQDPHGPLELPPVTLNGVQANLAPHDLNQQPYQDEGFDDFQDFVNFIDGVGLSAQWTPEYDLDWPRLEQHQPSRRPSRELISHHSPGPEDIGSPFSTWLPSAPADDQVHLRSQSGDGESKICSRLGLRPHKLLTRNNRHPREEASQEWHISCHRRS